jgi:hypothetical protein
MNGQLESLGHSKDKPMIERRLFQFANDADVNRRGGLDNPALIMKRMPDDLKDVRKITIGRHRVYFTGHNTQCSYTAIYVKLYKKTGVDDEDDPRHQKQLVKATLDNSLKEIKDPDAPSKD